MSLPPSPAVHLVSGGSDSMAAVVFALVERGALLRPELAGELRGSVLVRFADGDDCTAVRVDLCGEEIHVGSSDDEDRAHDLVVTGALADVMALLAAPLAGGLPKPTTALGRAALGRIADGRVDFDGSLRLARGVLRLLSARPEGRPRRGRSAGAGAERAAAAAD